MRLTTQLQIRNFVLFMMLMISIVANSVPPLITTFQDKYNLSIAFSSLIPIMGTLGGMTASLIGSIYVAQIGLKRFSLIYFFLSLTGCFLFFISNNAFIMIVANFICGMGLGAGLLVSSTIFAHLDEKMHNYGLYHAFFGVGGILAPICVSYILKKGVDYHLLFLVYAIILLISVVFTFYSKLENKKYPAIKIGESFKILKNKFIYISVILLLLYAGMENGLVIWNGNLFKDVFLYSKDKSSLVLSLFWFVFTFGRLITQQLENMLGLVKVVYLSLLSSFIALIMLLITGHPLFMALLAIGLAPLFPVFQKFAVKSLPPREVGLFNGLIYGLNGIGVTLIMGMMGVLGNINLYLAFTLPIMNIVVLVLLFRGLVRTKRAKI